MRKVRVFLVMAVLVLTLSVGAFAFQNEPEGFRELKWGDPPTEEMECYSSSEETAGYLLPKDKMAIGNVGLSVGAFAFQNEPEGFRELKWGDPPTEEMIATKCANVLSTDLSLLALGTFDLMYEKIISPRLGLTSGLMLNGDIGMFFSVKLSGGIKYYLKPTAPEGLNANLTLSYAHLHGLFYGIAKVIKGTIGLEYALPIMDNLLLSWFVGYGIYTVKIEEFGTGFGETLKYGFKLGVTF